ncbi:glycosyltransferase N-terminal domain-containing protein [Roseovarius salis]|uniref:3-deoxy-D-manno-octulosonic acid transferase n=1 Tax=Roseovarius salis TaxID=3376063 RepID=UPI0037C66BF7
MGRAGLLGARLAPGRNRAGAGATPDRPRPPGELVWFHATQQSHADAAAQLAERLVALRPGLHVLLTSDKGAEPRETQPTHVIVAPLPDDSGSNGNDFLSYWRPDICLWAGGALRPGLLTLAHRQGIPLYLVDADEAHLSRPGWRWLPDASRQALKRVSMVLARNTATETYLRRRIGLRETPIVVTGTLREESKPLPYKEEDREELAGILRGRLVWLAARLRTDEIDTVLSANARVMRMSHRVLLVILPDDPGETQPFHDALDTAGLRYVTWSEGGMPDDSTQVILADTAGELGLWYRIAPITFMGGSLCEGAHGSDPNEPAAHGSAIVYGPNVRAYLPAYSRFAEAGAARIVRDAASLAQAVQSIIPPDQSAAMAHAAWDVATQGAAVMDRLVDVVNEALDTRAAS